MRKTAYGTLLLLFLVFLGFSTRTALAEEKPVLLKVPTWFALDWPGFGTTIKWVGDRIATISGGSIKMAIYEPGKLIEPREILDSVSKGDVNAGYSVAGYWQEKIPAAAFFTAVPFGPEASEYLAWLWYGNGMKLYQEMYDQAGYNVNVLVCGIIAPESSGWFRKPIKSPEDLKGLKMRFFGLGGQAMEKLGVSVSLLPGTEIFSALEKKDIDATEYSMPAIDQKLGLYKVAKYNYFPGWHQQATVLELLINKKVWNRMSDRQRMLLEVICKAATADSLAYTEAIQAKAMIDNAQKHGVRLIYWPEKMLDAFKKAWEEVAEEQAAKDAFFKKVWEDLEAFRSQYNIWQTYGFLPRPKPPMR